MVKDIFLQHGSVSDAICFIGNSSITHHHDDRDFSYPESGVGKSGEVVTNGVVFKGPSLRARSTKQEVGCLILDTRCWILVTASAKREAGCWIPDVGCWMFLFFGSWSSSLRVPRRSS